MELIMMILLAIVGVVGAAFSRLLADEFKAWSPWLIDRLIRRAVRKLPEDLQERMTEEWLSHTQEIPGEFGKILSAISLQRASIAINNKPKLSHRAIGVIGLLFIAPLMVLLSVLIYITTGKSVFVIGHVTNKEDDGKIIKTVFFRTDGPIGFILEKTSIKTLPIIFDIVLGKLSLGDAYGTLSDFIEVLFTRKN